MELNKVLLVGRLTRDPEYRNTTSGRPVANMRIAVNRRRSFDRESGEGAQDETVFVDITAWEKLAEFSHNYLTKGRLIFVEGRLRQENWQDRETGANRTKISVVAERVQFADPKPEGSGGTMRQGEEMQDEEQRPASNWPAAPAQNAAPAPAPKNPSTEDDLPF
ncbi:single-stranded DNA-binding protein [bacterium]|nr:single-stranded DNA-binding protein [bacterium]